MHNYLFQISRLCYFKEAAHQYIIVTGLSQGEASVKCEKFYLRHNDPVLKLISDLFASAEVKLDLNEISK